ncbi:uncharacterized protein LOC111713623 [Eurytemora carolleeae]|uniref:uncharacterized protein LOC111713623 n=1 Tax=Eurytemora carolleeae TaxID=1294199 RepID=UPI000C7806CC|nr:uncharacterized protein LOC111713623 [Eurytemora carolleeae]|eukprot:XP_023344301.1 uncharacterized protein LOC111713623 [Eurytemora affinis]
MAGNETDLFKLIGFSLEPLKEPEVDLHQTIKAICLVSSIFFLVASFIFNLAVILNICITGKARVAYFRLFLLYSFLHFCFQLTVGYIDTKEILRAAVEPSKVLDWLDRYSPLISRSVLGILFLLVSALTIERFLYSTITGAVNTCFQLISTLLALSCPTLLAAFQILSAQRPTSKFYLDNEVWFGLEVGTFIILPLFILTIFGTINYCKISISSRPMPSSELVGVKTNIGLVVITNISIFIFLIQECLMLWLSQLNSKSALDMNVKNMHELVSVSLLCVRMGLNLIQFLVPLVVLHISSSCCYKCCCPAINQLEETRYKPVSRVAENINL